MNKYSDIIISSINNYNTNIALVCLICALMYYFYKNIYLNKKNTNKEQFKNIRKKRRNIKHHVNKKPHVINTINTIKRPSILSTNKLHALPKKNKGVRFKLD